MESDPAASITKPVLKKRYKHFFADYVKPDRLMELDPATSEATESASGPATSEATESASDPTAPLSVRSTASYDNQEAIIRLAHFMAMPATTSRNYLSRKSDELDYWLDRGNLA